MKNMRETEQDTSGFPTGAANMGGLKSKHGGSMGGAMLKCCQKIPVKEFI